MQEKKCDFSFASAEQNRSKKVETENMWIAAQVFEQSTQCLRIEGTFVVTQNTTQRSTMCCTWHPLICCLIFYWALPVQFASMSFP